MDASTMGINVSLKTFKIYIDITGESCIKANLEKLEI